MHLTRDAAREDVAQLVTLLAESHPDPYSASGGPVAFHRLAHDILAAIPDGGLSDTSLLRLLRPLVAAVGDGHTRIGHDNPVVSGAPRPWLEWEVVEQELYLAAVYRAQDTLLLGARLRALGGVPFAELRARMGRLQGYDNEYQDLLHLADALAKPPLLSELLHCDTLPAALDLALLLPNDTMHAVTVPLSAVAPGPRIAPPSAVVMPEMTAAQIGWRFLDDSRRVAYLRADSMMHYREAFEYSLAVGSKAHLGLLEPTVRRAHPADVPDDTASRLALVPSATALLRDLFGAMRDSGTPNLLVDLRFCPGGNSFFALFLEYFLYGLEAILASDEGYQVKRYSPLYLANRLATTRDELELYFQNGGYDFTEEEHWQRIRRTGLTTEDRNRRLQEITAYIALMPAFAQVFELRQDEAIWTPRVIALTAARTYSAGFDVVAALAQHGADVVGVPSAQAGNCFIDILPYTLTHSSLRGIVSYKWSRMFPDDPDRGKVLRPTHELTYTYLARQRFDPHATITLALESLGI